MADLPTPEAESLDLDRWAQRIVDRGLAVPAVFFLELHRPLAHIASQAMIVGSPLLAPLLGLDGFEKLRGVLADDDQYEALLARIEAHAARDAKREA